MGHVGVVADGIAGTGSDGVEGDERLVADDAGQGQTGGRKGAVVVVTPVEVGVVEDRQPLLEVVHPMQRGSRQTAREGDDGVDAFRIAGGHRQAQERPHRRSRHRPHLGDPQVV